jgi:hypothetical protein
LEQAAARAVRRYVDSIKAGSLAGAGLTRQAIERRMVQIDAELVTAAPMRELRLVQERYDLIERAARYEREDDFVEVARAYSRRHGITYAAWRDIGIPVAVLRRAGVHPDQRDHRTRP